MSQVYRREMCSRERQQNIENSETIGNRETVCELSSGRREQERQGREWEGLW